MLDYKEQSCKLLLSESSYPMWRKCGVEMLDNNKTSHSVEKSDNKFAFLAFAKGQYISKYETENIWNINFSQNIN